MRREEGSSRFCRKPASSERRDEQAAGEAKDAEEEEAEARPFTLGEVCIGDDDADEVESGGEGGKFGSVE